MMKMALIVSTLALIAVGFVAEAQAQRGVHCTSQRIGNTTYTNCY
jgi:hypothetical protein